MTSLFSARRSAEEFAAAVDDAGARRARSPEVTSLLEVVTTLRAQPPVAPRDEFSRDLRARLMTEAETTLRPSTATLVLPVRTRGARERRLVAAASAFVLIGGTTTMAAAAQGSLPGEALYPIKRGIERAEASLNLSPAGKGEDLLNQATGRLAEVKGLLRSDTTGVDAKVSDTLGQFSSTAAEGSSLMFEAYRETGDSSSVVEVRHFAAAGIATLESLAGSVPESAHADLSQAAAELRDIDAEAASLCGSCAPELPPLEVPAMLLVHADTDRAMRLAAQETLANDHPVRVAREVVERAAAGAGGAAPAPGAATSTPQPGKSAPAPQDPGPLPGPDWQPQPWPTLLPGLEGSTTDDGTTEPPSALEDLVDGLSGAVETLLPDPGGLLP